MKTVNRITALLLALILISGSFVCLAAALPKAMSYAFSNLRENRNYIVEYIYENNPDVTLNGMMSGTSQTTYNSSLI